MDIAGMSVILNQNAVQRQASISVMKLAMGVAATKGEFITSLVNENAKAMELTVQPHLGSRIDVQA